MNSIVYKNNGTNNYRRAASFCSGDKSLLTMIITYFVQFNKVVEMEKVDDENIIFWNIYLEDEFDSFEDIPKLTITQKNFDEIIEAWNVNVDNPKRYLVLSQDGFGWISLDAKNELSSDDLASIEQDRKAGQEWEEKWKKQANANWFTKKFRSLHYGIRCFVIKLYKRIKEFFE